MEEIEASVTFNGEDIAALRRGVKAAHFENKNLKVLYQEHYTRRGESVGRWHQGGIPPTHGLGMMIKLGVDRR